MMSVLLKRQNRRFLKTVFDALGELWKRDMEMEMCGMALKDDGDGGTVVLPRGGNLLELLREHSYRKGKFTLASGKESDFYIDCKQTFLRRDGLWSAAAALESHIIGREAIAVAGERVGGAPLAAAISMYTAVMRPTRALHPVIVRKQPKDHGTGHRVERARDVVPDGSRVVLVEDVLTSGGSALRAAQALVDDGLKVVAVIALVSRREGAEELLYGKFDLFSLYKREDFVDG